ncbi:hypothetical protein BC938DRAFT_474789, partial [Jimgerdemannia flammicorona]
MPVHTRSLGSLPIHTPKSHDPSFEALAALPGHISSFVADANDGRILDVWFDMVSKCFSNFSRKPINPLLLLNIRQTTSDPKEAQAQALTAYQILQDVTHLLAKQHEDVQAKEQPGAL